MHKCKTFERLSEDWKGLRKIVIFGFGKMGRGNIDALISRFEIVKIIDNNKDLRGHSYKEIEIVDFMTYNSLGIKEKIVVVTSGNRYDSISKELEEKGYKEDIDFCSYVTFCNDYFWNDRNELFLGRLTFNITTFCTLNCKNCTMLTPYNNHKKNFPIDRIITDVELTFDMVDYVSNFLVLGGEPFLHRELNTFLCYIGEHNRHNIGNLQIITNGTLVPSEELLETIKKYNVEVRISDYTKRVNYDEKLKIFCKKLEAYQIDYVSYGHDEWLDMGFPGESVNMGDTAEELHRHMIKCDPNCQNVSEGKLYYCAQGWAAQQSGLFNLRKSDYLDLESIRNSEDKKEQFRKFYFGNLEEGYFSFCKVCRGWDTDITVPGGIQCDMDD